MSLGLPTQCVKRSGSKKNRAMDTCGIFLRLEYSIFWNAPGINISKGG